MTKPPDGPVFSTTPPEAVERVHVAAIDLGGGLSVPMVLPVEPDRLLDHPVIEAFNLRDQYMPYWADIWPSARMLAVELTKADWPAWAAERGIGRVRALELGCGVGLAGVVALRQGMHVTFSDYDLTALDFARRCAELNGFELGTDFGTLALDWRYPPAGEQFDVILGADLIYEERNHGPIIDALKAMLAPRGVALVGDQNRTSAPLFERALGEAGFRVGKAAAVTEQRPKGPVVAGTVYRVGWG